VRKPTWRRPAAFVVDIDRRSLSTGQPRHADGKVCQTIADSPRAETDPPLLNAGVLANGVVIEREEGTAARGPLAPLLAMWLLDEVDKELSDATAFVRYGRRSDVYVSDAALGDG